MPGGLWTGNGGSCGLRLEYVVHVTGNVKARPEKMVNDKIATGHYEVSATKLKIMSVAEGLPILVGSNGYESDEEVCMKYRYLDLCANG